MPAAGLRAALRLRQRAQDCTDIQATLAGLPAALRAALRLRQRAQECADIQTAAGLPFHPGLVALLPTKHPAGQVCCDRGHRHSTDRAIEDTAKRRLILLSGLERHPAKALRLGRLVGVVEGVSVEGIAWIVVRLLEMLG